MVLLCCKGSGWRRLAQARILPSYIITPYRRSRWDRICSRMPIAGDGLKTPAIFAALRAAPPVSRFL